MTSEQCRRINNVLFRRTPDFDRELARDRFPFNYLYTGMYDSGTWEPGTGDTHTWDKVHVTRPNDDGCWDEVSIGGSSSTICSPVCAPARLYTGWGSTRASYGKFHRDYQTPVFCYDQLRDVEQVVNQLSAIVEGHKELPDEITSDFLRLYSIRSANQLYIAGSANTTVTVSAGMFLSNCSKIDLGGTGNLPSSKLTVQYLNNHISELMYNGYFKKAWFPPGKFGITMDIETEQTLTVQNPALTAMYDAADFSKGGKFFDYGVVGGIGPWLFKRDNTPMRFQHIGAGVLQRIWPYENVAATVGKKPEFSTDYKNAQYQMYHVFNRDARLIKYGTTTPVNGDMKFNTSRNMMGKWSWKSPDYFRATDPNTGAICEYMNDKKNMGYFLAEFELGVKTVYPEIEMIIIAQRQPQVIVDDPYCGTAPSMIYQSLTPYNTLCAEGE
jgi:hypothetical protein